VQLNPTLIYSHYVSQKQILSGGVSILPLQLPMHHNLVSLANQFGPLFSGSRFAPLSQVHVTSVMRQLLHGTGTTQSHYSSHSFHIGTATTAAAAELLTTLIKTLGHWKSNAYETYVQFLPSSLNGVPSILGCTDVSTQPTWNPDDVIP